MAQKGIKTMVSQKYMQHLAEQFDKGEIKFLNENDEFEFACDQCGKCCRNREDIIITPFDLYHLVRATGKNVSEVVSRYGNMYIGENSHLPLIQLRYRQEFDGSTTCYFLGRRDGKYICRVHEDKPGVCRSFPLGKMAPFKKDQAEKADFEPKYFRQEPSGKGECVGSDRAKEQHVMQRVVDWVGGKEKKRLSDRYSSLFNRFMEEFIKAFDEKKLNKREPGLQKVYYDMLGALMYFLYDFEISDDAYLDWMEQNLNDGIQLTLLMMNDPEGMTGWCVKLFDRLKARGLPDREAV